MAALDPVPAGRHILPGRKRRDPPGASCTGRLHELVCPDHPRRQPRRLGTGHHRRAVPAMGRSAPAQCHRPLHPLRHRGGRAASGRSRQRQPAQRRALPGPDVSGPATHPRRGPGRRPPQPSSTRRRSGSTAGSPGLSTKARAIPQRSSSPRTAVGPSPTAGRPHRATEPTTWSCNSAPCPSSSSPETR